LIISAHDTSFSVAAHEALPCQYDGDKMDIGFKSSFLIEVLSNLSFEEASLELADPSRAALILDAGEHNPCEEVCSLLMPVRLA
jgi:DNA polymerase-3 subunit beta